VQELVERLRLDLQHRFLLGEDALLHQVHRDVHRGQPVRLPLRVWSM
jgi:hypothetical protein